MPTGICSRSPRATRTASIDAAISSFVFVCIPETEVIQAIVSEVYRVLRPGATYAMLDVNPDSVGVRDRPVRRGRAGRADSAGGVRRAGGGADAGGADVAAVRGLFRPEAGDMRKRPAGTVPCGSFGGPLTKSVHVITEIGNPLRDETLT